LFKPRHSKATDETIHPDAWQLADVAGKKAKVNAYTDYVNRLGSKKAKAYAGRLFEYYRDYGTVRQIRGPLQEDYLPNNQKQATRISWMVRSIMVGDVDSNGNKIDKNRNKV
jgi:hypothetical protein